MQETVGTKDSQVSQSLAPHRIRESTAPRNIAVNAYRGLVMLLMMGEVMRFAAVAHSFPNSLFWRILAFNQSHVQWAGASLHDTIQPSFSFLVGVALPYSIHSRSGKGQSFKRQLAHTIWRSLVLVFLGIFLRSTHSGQTNFTFEDTLTQIGLGYTFAFLLAYCRPSGNGRRLRRSCLVIGWRGLSIRRRDLISITPLLGFSATGTITSPGSHPTGTRTATLAGRLTPGF